MPWRTPDDGDDEDWEDVEADEEDAAALIPAGVREASEVPKEECLKCGLGPTDHSAGRRFQVGHIGLNVCLKDYAAYQTKHPICEECRIRPVCSKRKPRRGENGLQICSESEPIQVDTQDNVLWKQIQDSYAGEKIASGKNVPKPFNYHGLDYLMIGGFEDKQGPDEAYAYMIVPRSAYSGKTLDYGTPNLEDPLGSYNGMVVNRASGEAVLLGPEVTFRFIGQKRGEED